jgi:hypothetical protein
MGCGVERCSRWEGFPKDLEHRLHRVIHLPLRKPLEKFRFFSLWIRPTKKPSPEFPGDGWLEVAGGLLAQRNDGEIIQCVSRVSISSGVLFVKPPVRLESDQLPTCALAAQQHESK